MKVTVRFFDDERLAGDAPGVDFDEPDFQLAVEGPAELENNETAWIPLSSVKWMELPLEEAAPDEAPPRRVAIRFLDGEVLRGHLGGGTSRHRYGMVIHLHPEAPGPPRRLGIPFSAIKALFYVREFDGRPLEEHGEPSDAYVARRTMAPLLDVLEEMDMLNRLHESGVLSDEEFRSKRSHVLERM